MKYELTDNTLEIAQGVTLRQIKCKETVELGGWVQLKDPAHVYEEFQTIKIDETDAENPFTIANLRAVESVLNPRNYATNLIESICPHFGQHVLFITKFKAMRDHYEYKTENEKYIGDAYNARISLRVLSEDLKVALDSLHKVFPSLKELDRVVNLAREFQVKHDKLKEDLNSETNKKLNDLRSSYKDTIKELKN